MHKAADVQRIEIVPASDESCATRLRELLVQVTGLELPVAELPAAWPSAQAPAADRVDGQGDLKYDSREFEFTAAELEGIHKLAADAGVTHREAIIGTVGLFLSRYASGGAFQLGFQVRSESTERMPSSWVIKRLVVDASRAGSIRKQIRSARDGMAAADRWNEFAEDWDERLRDCPVQVAVSLPPADLPDATPAAPSPLNARGNGTPAADAAPIIWFVVESDREQFNPRLAILTSRRHRLRISAERLFDQYRVLIATAACDPGAPLETVCLPAPEEEQLLLTSWAGKAGVEPHESFLTLFLRQVLQKPEAIALCWQEQRWTYAALMENVTRISTLLSAYGVGRNDLVAVCLNRDPNLIASLIAIFQVGAAYVPVDPAYPPERQKYILLHSRSKIVLTVRRFADRVLADGLSAIFLDEIADGTTITSPRVGPEFRASDAAYVIYTSGSTGNPKGVVIEHGNLAAFLRWASTLYDLADLGGVLASTSICFDLSIFEIFLPLSQGGMIILCHNVLEIFESPWRDMITLINTVPSAMAALLRLQALPPSVRVVNLAGEAFPKKLSEALAASKSIRRVFNLYGPTEATVYSTVAQLNFDVPMAPPIGRPIAGTQVYVLDEDLRLCPVGVAGELYLGGAGLARGYLNNQAGTEERFIRNPFGGPGSRLYRTGDRVRYNEGGELEFLGRNDHQVKIRGFRIELEEISAHLEKDASVREALAIVVSGPGGDPRLCAYVVPEDATSPPQAERLRQGLRAQLPAYMVPDAYKLIDAIPLTPNGKLDRKALPIIDWQKDGQAGLAGATPRDESGVISSSNREIERGLAEIWAQLLGIETHLVGRSAHFLHLGGHSLSAVQAIARIRDAFQVELSLTEFFENLTFSSQCDLLRTLRGRRSPRGGAVMSSREMAMSYAQERFWFFAQAEPLSSSYNLAGIIWIEGELDPSRLQAALAEVVRRHHVLRTSFSTNDGVPRPTLLSTADITIRLDVIDLFALCGENAQSAEQMASEDAARLASGSFDLAKPPLFRVRLARLAQTRHALLFAAHHIIFDGWSFEVLTRDLASAYGAAGHAITAVHAPGHLQYSDFAAWQRSPDQRASQGEMIDYFRRTLRGAPPVIDFPTRVLGGKGAGSGRTFVTRPLARTLFEQLLAFAREEDATPFVILLAAFAAAVHRHRGVTDIVIGSAFAGRTRTEFENLIGCFINTLPLRLRFHAQLSFRKLVAKTNATALEVHERQDLPLDRLVESLKPRRIPGRNPLFQVAFGVENAPSTTQGVGDNSFSWEEIELAESRLDLTVWITEKNGSAAARWRWNSRLFNEAAICSLNSVWQIGLARALGDPDSPLERLFHASDIAAGSDNS